MCVFALQVGRQQFDPGGVPTVDPERGGPAAAATTAARSVVGRGGGGGGGGVARPHAAPGDAALGLGHRLQRHHL